LSQLYGFFDESGIHGGARRCVLAGYIGSVRQGLLFEKAWLKVLSDFNLPEFHAKKFFAAREEPYRSLSSEEQRKLLDGLLGAIHQHGITPVAASVVKRDFEQLTQNERRFVTGGLVGGNGNYRWRTSGAPSKPYFLVFQWCIAKAVKLAKVGKVVQFIFDQQNEYAPLALQLFQEAKLLLSPEESARVGGCAFLSRLDAPPLQAADLLAHCWYSQQEQSADKKRNYALRELTARFDRITVFNSRSFEIMFEKVPEDVRAFVRGDAL